MSMQKETRSAFEYALRDYTRINDELSGILAEAHGEKVLTLLSEIDEEGLVNGLKRIMSGSKSPRHLADHHGLPLSTISGVDDEVVIESFRGWNPPSKGAVNYYANYWDEVAEALDLCAESLRSNESEEYVEIASELQALATNLDEAIHVSRELDQFRVPFKEVKREFIRDCDAGQNDSTPSDADNLKRILAESSRKLNKDDLVYRSKKALDPVQKEWNVSMREVLKRLDAASVQAQLIIDDLTSNPDHLEPDAVHDLGHEILNANESYGDLKRMLSAHSEEALVDGNAKISEVEAIIEGYDQSLNLAKKVYAD